MYIIDMTIQQVKDIAADNRRQSDDSPVRAQPIDAKSFSDEGWEASEEETVGYTCKA
jgi:hypothetical protein